MSVLFGKLRRFFFVAVALALLVNGYALPAMAFGAPVDHQNHAAMEKMDCCPPSSHDDANPSTDMMKCYSCCSVVVAYQDSMAIDLPKVSTSFSTHFSRTMPPAVKYPLFRPPPAVV